MISGSCLCGGVSFVIEGEALWSHHCHCSRCRKSTGSAFSSPLIVRPGSIRFASGADLVSRYELPGSSYTTNFCRVCGCAVPAVETAENQPVWSAPMGSLDDDPASPPVGHIYVGSKAAWHTIHDDLPQAEEMPSEELQEELRKRF